VAFLKNNLVEKELFLQKVSVRRCVIIYSIYQEQKVNRLDRIALSPSHLSFLESP